MMAWRLLEGEYPIVLFFYSFFLPFQGGMDQRAGSFFSACAFDTGHELASCELASRELADGLFSSFFSSLSCGY